MPDWMFEQVGSPIHEAEREEARCARWAAEDAGEFDDYYAEREAAKHDDWDGEGDDDDR